MITSLISLIRSLQKPVTDPYAKTAQPRAVVAAGGGKFDPKSENGTSASATADLPGVVGFISRHALASVVSCPVCSGCAAEANPWRRLLTSEKYGEGIGCDSCGAMLWACPDDDLDPVKPTEKYDEKIYHKFVRPDGWEPPRQRTTSADPTVGDWVVIEGWQGPVEVNGKILEMPLDRSEGVVIKHDAKNRKFKIALGGNEGVGGQGSGGQGTLGGAYADVPEDCTYVMIQPILRVGDRVRVIRGERRREQAVITGMSGASVTLHAAEESFVVPIEFIEKIYLDERI